MTGASGEVPTADQTVQLALVAANAQAETMTQEAKLRKAFAVFDRDGDGNLDADELKAVLMRGNSPFTEQDVEALIKEFDTDGNGVIDFDEFAPLWEGLYGGGDELEC